MKKSFCIIFLLFLYASFFAAQYSEDYFGLSLEYQKLDFIDGFQEKDCISQSNFNFLFTYGPSFSGPFRFRIGGGVHELSDYYLNGGIELKVLEFLNTVKGRIFGLYLNADLKLGLDYAEASIKGELFIPFSAVGGIQIGVGINHDIKPLFTIAYSGGVYPLITK